MRNILDRMIVFEGLDGAGTTTQARLLADKIKSIGKDAYTTHEPTDNPIGKVVRSVLQKKITTTPEALALLYSADRHDHLYNPDYGIASMMEKGCYVIADRYFYSSIAYQGIDCNAEFVSSINKYPHPGYVIFIDTPVEDCINRIEKRGDEKELFDKADFLSKVRESYKKQFASIKEDTKVLTIDGRLEIDQISALIWNWIRPFIL